VIEPVASPTTAVGPRLLVDTLRRIGVTLAAYLPDEWLEPLIDEVERADDIRGVRVAREDEGIGICAGAFFGGKRAVLITQNSGILLSGNAIVGCAILHHAPFLMLVSYTGSVTDRRFYQINKGRATEPVLQALGLRYAVIDEPEQGRLVEDLAAYAYQSAQPAVALLGRGILGA
jgi:sulfopyruvate decarboxylase subunit alpha